MNNLKTQLKLIGIALCLFAVTAVQAEILPYVKVREVTDLQVVGQEARVRKLPILIMFSIRDCPYCDVVREEFLKPMLRSGDYTDRVIMLELYSDSYARVRDFNGELISAGELIHRYKAGFAPTVVFLDSQGNEQAERLIGITTRDFYGGFLDESIDESLQRVRDTAIN
ncbi:MAG: thioredoxin fold domain-containing protein [Halobacteria archaeon]|nr:thioredoxin fold domain-containing protein [Halobacteria archaeon]